MGKRSNETCATRCLWRSAEDWKARPQTQLTSPGRCDLDSRLAKSPTKSAAGKHRNSSFFRTADEFQLDESQVSRLDDCSCVVSPSHVKCVWIISPRKYKHSSCPSQHVETAGQQSHLAATTANSTAASYRPMTHRHTEDIPCRSGTVTSSFLFLQCSALFIFFY